MKALCILAALVITCIGLESLLNAESKPEPVKAPQSTSTNTNAPAELKTATFGAGCFWCVEAVFERIEGVKDVRSGYAGGPLAKPTYKQVCRGDTGHAEVIELQYNPKLVTFKKLVDTFFEMHDPTTLNRQGNDSGTQYRSVIFFHDDEQKAVAEAAKKAVDASGKHTDPVVTQIVPAEEFYKAEDEHQDFFQLNPNNGYNRAIIAPKLKKLGIISKPVVDK